MKSSVRWEGNQTEQEVNKSEIFWLDSELNDGGLI